MTLDEKCDHLRHLIRGLAVLVDRAEDERKKLDQRIANLEKSEIVRHPVAPRRFLPPLCVTRRVRQKRIRPPLRWPLCMDRPRVASRK
jgi:hypothetical protein